MAQVISAVQAAMLDSMCPAANGVGLGTYLRSISTEGVRIGDWVAAGATTGGVAITAAKDYYGDGQIDIMAVYAASATNLGGAYSAKAGRFRHVVNCTTCGHESYGLVGQLVVKSTTLSLLHSGIMGTLEGNTTGVVANPYYTYGVAAITARVGGAAYITATKPVCGFLAFWNGAALASGAGIAFGACASSTTAWTTGLCLPRGSVVQGIRVGDWVGAGALGSAILFSTAQNIYSDGQLDTIAAYGESATNLTSAYSAKVGRFRHVVNCTTCAHETYGLVGQVVVKDTTLTHLHAGLMGTLEGNTSGAVANPAYTYGVSAVTARIGGGAYITATKPVCGFLAFWNGAALASGAAIAYGACASSTTPWTTGLCLPRGSVVQAVRIGDWVGSASAGSAILFSTAQNIYSDGQLDTFAAFGESTGDLTSAYSAKVGRFRHVVTCSADTVINQETYGLVGQVVVKNGSMNHYHAGLMGTFEVQTLCHVQTDYGCAAVIGRVGSPYTTIESGGLLAGVLALSNTSDTSFTHTGTYAAFAAKTVSGRHAWDSLIEVPSDLATSQNATGVPGANPYVIKITINGVAKLLLCADTWATS